MKQYLIIVILLVYGFVSFSFGSNEHLIRKKSNYNQNINSSNNNLTLVPIAFSDTLITHPLCTGDTNGSLDITVTGGNIPYTYLWSNGATTEDLSGLADGTYSVTVSGSNPNQDITGSFTIIEPLVLNPNASVTDVACFGDSTGEIDLNVTGGTSPYSYLWDDNETLEDRDTLSSGIYYVTITDANSCTLDTNFTIFEPAAALTSSGTVTDISCFGDTYGEINLTVTGGTTPYSYLWNDSETTEDRALLSAGTYSVTVTDGNNCNSIAGYTVTEPVNTYSVSSNITDVLCHGNSTGAIDINVVSAISPYTFLWSNSETTEDLTGLSSGTYSLIITDANSCTYTDSYTVTEPATALSSSSSVTNILCYGDETGEIDLTCIGGTQPYSYLWDDNSTSEDRITLSVGTYYVTIIDSNSCSLNDSYTITGPAAALSSNGVVTNVLCYGESTGEIDLSVTGGTQPYLYLWNDNSTSQNRVSLPTGIYNVTITDYKGCEYTDSYSISQPNSAVSVSSSLTNIQCNGDADGEIDVTVTGGTQSYSYLWNDSSTAEDRDGLDIGTYYVTITDSNNCETFDNYTITQPPTLDTLVTSSFENPSACGESDGSINLDVTGGVAPYQYIWSNSETTSDIILLLFGDYDVTVTDSNSCTMSLSFTLVEPNSPIVEFADSIKPCYDDSNGELFIIIQSGTPPYSYEWSTGATTQNITDIAEGVYSVTITDILNCSSTEDMYLYQYPSPVIELNSYNDSVCENENITFSESGPDANTWNWTGPGVSGSESNSSLSLSDVSINDEGWYSCQITASLYNDCPADTSVFLKVNLLPDIPNVAGEFEICSGEFPVIYQIENTLPGMAYHWSLNNGYVSSWADSSVTLIAWDNIPGNYDLYLQITNMISECENEESFSVEINSNYAPNETQIVYNSGMNILVCEDEAPGINYQWGFDTIATGGEYYIPGEILRYCVIPHTFNSTLFAYWVETYFVYDGEVDTCIYRTYFNNSPYAINDHDGADFEFNIFPNPLIYGELYLQIENLNLTITRIYIYNIYGQKVIESEFPSSNKGVDVRSLMPGVYVIITEHDNRAFITRKFIVN